jgi:hypothetical protein
MMSSSTKREVSHHLREIKPKNRGSSRLNRKHPGSHSRKSSTSTEAKIPKIVKSTSSTEKAKLETLYIPNKGSPKVIKSHEDSENSKSTEKTKLETLYSPNKSSPKVIKSDEDSENSNSNDKSK